MKIAVVAANGKAGRLIVKEVVERGMDVTAIARSENKTVAEKFFKKDLFELTKEDLAPFDVVIDAFGTWGNDAHHLHSKSLAHLSDLVSGTDKRLLVIGGAGSLYMNKEHTVRVMDAPDFPEDYKPTATAMGDSLNELRKRNDVKWTYISPAAEFEAEGARTGEYILAGEEFTVNEKGESKISYADYAIAMVDEATKGRHIQERISVLSK